MDRKYTFDVQSVRGQWTDIKQAGELVFNAVCHGVDGTIRIYRDKRNIKIQLDFAKVDKLTPNIILEVSSFQKL